MAQNRWRMAQNGQSIHLHAGMFGVGEGGDRTGSLRSIHITRLGSFTGVKEGHRAWNSPASQGIYAIRE
jgi:hypothetical protein